jgi:hypothetical protein
LSDEELKKDVAAWVFKKFGKGENPQCGGTTEEEKKGERNAQKAPNTAYKKLQQIRNKFWPGADWCLKFVYANVAEEKEVKYIDEAGIETLNFDQCVVPALLLLDKNSIRAGWFGEMAEIMNRSHLRVENAAE